MARTCDNFLRNLAQRYEGLCENSRWLGMSRWSWLMELLRKWEGRSERHPRAKPYPTCNVVKHICCEHMDTNIAWNTLTNQNSKTFVLNQMITKWWNNHNIVSLNKTQEILMLQGINHHIMAFGPNSSQGISIVNILFKKMTIPKVFQTQKLGSSQVFSIF